MSNQASDYKIVDIIDTVIETVRNTRDTSIEVKAHAVKMILYRDHNIDVSITTLRRRLKLRGEV